MGYVGWHDDAISREEVVRFPAEGNDSMPFHMLDLASEALAQVGRKLEDSTVAVMGASFLQDTGDPRNSPSVPIVESLRSAKALRVHDPYLEEISGVRTVSDAKKALEGADLAIFMVAHKGYDKLSPALLKKLMRTPVVVDGRNLFSMEKMTRAGIIYAGVGKRSVLGCKTRKQ